MLIETKRDLTTKKIVCSNKLEVTQNHKSRLLLFNPTSRFSLIHFFLLHIVLFILISSNLSRAQQSVHIDSSFFGMTIRPQVQWPTVPIGLRGKTNGDAWGYRQPQKESIKWQFLDSLVNSAVKRNINYVYSFMLVPQWASSNPNDENYFAFPPDSIQYWNNFVTSLVTRYKGKIKYYELWNEPNNDNKWMGTIAQFLVLAKNAYQIIKSIDSSAIVLLPATSAGRSLYQQTWWIKEYLQAGGFNYADGCAFHAYPNNNSDNIDSTFAYPGIPLLAQIDTLRSIFDKYGMEEKSMFNTEGSWRRQFSLPDLDKQVSFLARWYILQAARGIKFAVWYQWGADSEWGNILNSNGDLSPAAIAYQQLFDWLAGSDISTEINNNKDVWTCNISRGNEYKGLLIWNSHQLSRYRVPPQYTRYRDLMGNVYPVPPNKEIIIDTKPILVDNQTPGNTFEEFFELNQNYPNPFNQTTIIKYNIPQPGRVTIKIYDVLGREVEKLVDEEQSPGNYWLLFNGMRLSSGVYFYQIRLNEFTSTKKMIVLK